MPRQKNHSELRKRKGTGCIPASRTTQNKIHTIRLKDGIKFLYRKKRKKLNKELYYAHLKAAQE